MINCVVIQYLPIESYCRLNSVTTVVCERVQTSIEARKLKFQDLSTMNLHIGLHYSFVT